MSFTGCLISKYRFPIETKFLRLKHYSGFCFPPRTKFKPILSLRFRFYIRKRPQTEGNDICKKEPKEKPNTDVNLSIITEKPKEAIQTNGNVAYWVKNNQENAEKVPELNKIATKLPKGSDNLAFVQDEDNSKKEEEAKEKPTEETDEKPTEETKQS